jgi:hypothetical protein
MSTVEFHPWNSRRADVERPDEWRIDLDPMPGCEFATVRRVALSCTRYSTNSGWPGGPRPLAAMACTFTSGSSHGGAFADLRRAAHAFAREVERRAPGEVMTTWWRKDRDPTVVYVDYNQNARDHTIASPYSVRGVPEATVSTPITWDEIGDVNPRQFTIATVPPASPSSATCTRASMAPPTRCTPCWTGQTARPRLKQASLGADPGASPASAQARSHSRRVTHTSTWAGSAAQDTTWARWSRTESRSVASLSLPRTR